ncbi:MAG: PucR family transcriptional regulator [Micrococcaceae bacterium]
MSMTPVTFDRVQQVVDGLAEALGRSVGIDNGERQHITCSRHFGDEDQLRVSVLVSRTLDPVASEFLYSFQPSDGDGPFQVPSNPNIGIMGRRCYPIPHRDRPVGYIWLIGDASTLEDNLVLDKAEVLAALLAPELDEKDRLSEAKWAEATRALCTAEGRASLPEIIDSLDLQTGTSVCVLTSWKPQNDRPQSNRAFLSEQAAHVLPPKQGMRITTPISAADGQITVSLMHSATSIETTGLPTVASLPELSKPGLSAATATSSWDSPKHLSRLLSESVISLYLAQRDGSTHTTWSQTGFEGVLLCSSLDNRKQIVPSGVEELGALNEYRDLVRTVQTFLNESGNIGATADRLHIHRTTLYYRLTKAEKISGYSLKSGTGRMCLDVGIRVLDFLDSDFCSFLRS